MKIIWALGFIFFTFHAQAVAPQCFDVFHYITNQESRTVLSLIAQVPTDRMTAFPQHADRPAHEYLSTVLQKQEQQFDTFLKTSFPSVPLRVKNYYAQLLKEALGFARQEIRQIQSDPKDCCVRMQSLIDPESSLQNLQSNIISVLTRPNTILAEFLVALRYPNIISTEVTVAQLLEVLGQKVPSSLYEVLSPQDVQGLLNKKLDVVSFENGSMVWVEVKYLGRDKIYNKVSGNAVLTKLKNIKLLAGFLKSKIRVVLVTVGPGQLSTDVMSSYQDEGVEVLSLR